MLKEIIIFSALCSFQLLAMDNYTVHTPKFREQASAALNNRLDYMQTSNLEEIGQCAFAGAAAPWMVSFLAGMAIHDLFHKNNDSDDDMNCFAGAGTGILFGSPISIALSLPLAAAGGSVGILRRSYQAIDFELHEKEFKHEVARTMFRWIHTIKAGRLALGQELKAWQKDHGVTNKKVAINNLLSNGAYERYFGETGLKQSDIAQRLEKVMELGEDSWGNFFTKLSNVVKIPELSEKKWKKLENTLVSYIGTDTFPALTQEDISKHLYAAAYFFIIAEHPGAIKTLKSLIS